MMQGHSTAGRQTPSCTNVPGPVVAAPRKDSCWRQSGETSSALLSAQVAYSNNRAAMDSKGML